MICTNCGKETSQYKARCTNCGSYPEGEVNARAKGFSTIAFLIIISLLIWGVSKLL